jgi:recombinational DNA repair protein RecR
MMNIPSKLLSDAVDEMASLPGVGRKTALRLVLHLLKQPLKNVERFGNTVIRMRKDLYHCEICNNISDTPVCSICSNKSRDISMICVVESIREVMSIENTMQYNGLFVHAGRAGRQKDEAVKRVIIKNSFYYRLFRRDDTLLTVCFSSMPSI